MQIKVLTDRPRRRGIKIKAFTPEETKIIAYDFDFEITAPPELIQLGIIAGFGGENALGFGATKLMN
jgi:CRISPR-associated endoribonuclease Cas6